MDLALKSLNKTLPYSMKVQEERINKIEKLTYSFVVNLALLHK
jgi:hypothetical protein